MLKKIGKSKKFEYIDFKDEIGGVKKNFVFDIIFLGYFFRYQVCLIFFGRKGFSGRVREVFIFLLGELRQGDD